MDVIALEAPSNASRGWNKGYPGRYGKGHKILGLDKIEPGIAVYFAGVDEDAEKGLITYGGRVLHVIAGDPTPDAQRKRHTGILNFSPLKIIITTAQIAYALERP